MHASTCYADICWQCSIIWSGIKLSLESQPTQICVLLFLGILQIYQKYNQTDTSNDQIAGLTNESKGPTESNPQS